MTDQPAEQTPPQPPPPSHHAPRFFQQDRIVFTVGGLISIALTWWLTKLLNIPAAPYRGGIVMQQPTWPVAMLVIWVLIIGCSILCATFASKVHYEGGLLCGCIGIAALAVRFGPIRFALFSAASPGIYFSMAIELILLYAAVLVAWVLLRGASKTGLLPLEPEDGPDEPIDQKLTAFAIQVVIGIVVMMLLSHGDAKTQTLTVVGLASYLGALGAHQVVFTRPSIWFFTGPLIVGVLGYLMQYFSPTDWMIGDAHGFFAGLAHPTPLDYVSMGPIGALLGYWTSHGWHQNRVLASADV